MVRAVIRVPGFEEAGAGGAAAVQPGPTAFIAGSSGGGGGGSSGRLSTVGKVPSLVFEMEDDDVHGSQHGARDGSPFAADATEVMQRLQVRSRKRLLLVGQHLSSACPPACLLPPHSTPPHPPTHLSSPHLGPARALERG